MERRCFCLIPPQLCEVLIITQVNIWVQKEAFRGTADLRWLNSNRWCSHKNKISLITDSELSATSKSIHSLFPFLEGKALVMARQSKQYCTGGGFLSDHQRPQHLLLPFMQIFKVHEKENKLNCNSRWNREGVDFAFHWWLADKTGTNSVMPEPSH